MIIYTVIGNVIVSAALVPDFMRKLEAFEEVTEKSYSEMVKTDDITENMKAAAEKTKAVLGNAGGTKEKITSDDGYALIAACFRQPEPEGRPWAVLLHGYTGWKEEMYHYAAKYYEKGFNILCPDLRCQGESDGDFIGMGWTDRYDVLDWIGKITDSYPDAEIVLHGESMGASCAVMMSGMDLPDNIKCVISDCAFTDSVSMFRKQLRDWFSIPDIGFIGSARLWLRIRGGYDLKDASAINEIKKSDTPTLFIQGDQDRIVPVSSAEELYESLDAEKDIMIVEGAGHAQSCYKDPDAYYGRVFGFIDRFLIYS
jgi:pimeloyl-ACP methyl ester carboxylesterase